MANEPCFPNWLTRMSVQRYGPNGLDNIIPYPVYQVSPPTYSADNANSNSVVKNDAYYQSAAAQIDVAVIDTRIVHIVPNNVYDTINITAFVSPGATAGPPRTPPIGVPLFFSYDRPGRILIETPLAGAVEAFVATARVLDPTDPSSYPTCIDMPQVMLNLALTAPAAIYTNFLYQTVKTDRAFYFWFGDGISTLPATTGIGGAETMINWKATWYVRGY
jgi:hypothetical protein